ncbi:hypothetical protein GGR54DRAFT_256942 [Hypoxylon sp. NC1633]|nr:hypothetical protein GGR54DRAFT_256942 [Hypoxylon sp. NC1633]
MASNPQASQSQPGFALFLSLPPELRIRIWKESFYPRVVELHWCSVIADGRDAMELVSNCSNPAALSVCSETRALAKEHFSVPLPIFTAGPRGFSSRLLYLNPTLDLLAVLGEVSYIPLMDLFRTIQELDPAGIGLQCFGLSIGCFAHNFQLATLRVWNRILFSRLGEFVLLMYDEERPPPYFQDGECTVEDVGGMDSFVRIFAANMRQLLDADHLRLMNLNFIPGPMSRLEIQSISTGV